VLDWRGFVGVWGLTGNGDPSTHVSQSTRDVLLNNMTVLLVGLGKWAEENRTPTHWDETAMRGRRGNRSIQLQLAHERREGSNVGFASFFQPTVNLWPLTKISDISF
jgi:hypothetical protein